MGNRHKQAYRFVILDCPYDTWDSELTRELFGKLILLKLNGYLASYPYGTLPADTTDFVGTHHLFCKEVGGELFPVMAYKTMSLRRCKIHNLPFPALAITQAAGAVHHAEEVSKIVTQAEKKNLEISYDGSWTMSPDVRKDKVQSEYLKEVMMALCVQYHLSYQIPEIMGFGVLRFKTEQYFYKMGFHPVRHEGKELSPVYQKNLHGEPVVLMHLNKFSEGALSKAQEFKEIWEKRIEISQPNVLKQVA